MTIRAAVLTSIMDDYDTLKPVLQQGGAEVEWVCFTDSQRLLDESERTAVVRFGPTGTTYTEPARLHPTGWQIMHYQRPADVHPNRAAKAPKVMPHLFTAASVSVWIDASFRVVSPRFVQDLAGYAATSFSGIAQFRHPWRNCYYDEASISILLPKYAGEFAVINRQVQAYEQAGMPHGWGLWATGVIARYHQSSVIDWGKAWGEQINTYSYQDQISHPYTLWRAGLRPVDLPGTHLGNQWLAYEGSARHG